MATPTRYERINGMGWYFRPCEDCGVEIRDRNKDMTSRCRECHEAKTFEDGCERVISKIHEWIALYGKPPSAVDWNPNQAIGIGRPDKAKRYREGDWPSATTAQYLFGSWSNALEAAGLSRSLPTYGYGRYPGDDPKMRSEAVRLYAADLSAQKVADRLGISAESVRRWTREAGVTALAARLKG
jgi:hypothetical protein